MGNLKFEVWCRKAVSRIVLPKDRVIAGRELMNHMEDRYQDFLEQGLPREEAERRTIEAMGEAGEIARQLRESYDPFWYLMKQRTRKILAVLLCGVVFGLMCFVLTNEILYLGYGSHIFNRYDPYEDTYVSDGIGRVQRVFYEEPGVKASTDGYTLKVTRAALWHGTYVDTQGQQQEEDYFHFRVEVSNPLPWAEFDDVFRWFWAEDDLGNHYYAAYESSGVRESSVQGTAYQASGQTCVWEMYLKDYVSQEAQWIELHYDRAGRDVTLRIDLTGGEKA